MGSVTTLTPASTSEKLYFAFCQHPIFLGDQKSRIFNRVPSMNFFVTRPRGYKTFFMLNSTEHKISTAYRQMNKFLALSISDVVFIMLITGSTVAQWLSA